MSLQKIHKIYTFTVYITHNLLCDPVTGWDLERGITSPTEEKAALKRDLIAHARRRVLLADSSKYGAWSLFNVAHLNSLTDIVTDRHLDEDAQQILSQLDASLTLAP
jgi:DeoR/GlpR family transcriptional regulator of sugar metabolism